MNKQSIIGLVLIFVVMVGFAYLKSPSVEEREQKQKEYEQLQLKQIQAMVANTAKDSLVNEVQSSIGSAHGTVDMGNPFHASIEGKEDVFTIENEVFAIDFNNKGGKIDRIYLKDYLTYTKDSLFIFDSEYNDFYLSFFANNRTINTSELYFECLKPIKTKVEGLDSTQVKMRLYASLSDTIDRSRYIEFVYTIIGNEYMFDFDINIVNLQYVLASNTNFIDLTWNARLQQLEKSFDLERQNTSIFYLPINSTVDELSLTKDADSENINTPLKWISFKQQFFSVALIADSDFINADFKTQTDRNIISSDLKNLSALIGLPYSANEVSSFGMEIYAGPNKFKTLKSYNLDLERLVPIGWGFFLLHWVNQYAVIPVFDFLDQWGMNYGLIILLLTILLKLILFPITYKSYISSAKIRILQPEITEINKKYPKQEQAMDKQKAVMSLYKKAGASPLSGCIPMLIQFPILIAMFRFFPASIELRQQKFLWADDLSSYDSILNLPFTIPFYGDHVSLFALLMAGANFFYTKVTMSQNSSTQMPGMKYVFYLMPIMMLGLLNSYSSALNYYYFLSIVITFIQMWLIRKTVDDAKVYAKIQENKKKPVKKSKFQERLEEMARKQQGKRK